MRFINLTPHPVNIIKEDGSVVDIPASGSTIRRGVARKLIGDIAGIPIYETRFDAVDATHVPDQQEGVAYIVSNLALQDQLLTNRPDSYAPGELERSLAFTDDDLSQIQSALEGSGLDIDLVKRVLSLTRSAQGAVIGCKGLSTNAKD